MSPVWSTWAAQMIAYSASCDRDHGEMVVIVDWVTTGWTQDGLVWRHSHLIPGATTARSVKPGTIRCLKH